ncbi:MAG: hypothetical protein AB7T38_08630 [Nitrospirales bacterium]
MAKRFIKRTKKAKKKKIREHRRRQETIIKNKKHEKRHVPWKAPKIQMYWGSSPFPADLSREERINLIKEFGSNAKEKFDRKFQEIEKWFAEYDALEILSFCSFFFLTHQEGVDPEVEGTLAFGHNQLELLQAFSLMKARPENPKFLFEKEVSLKKELQEFGDLYLYKSFAEISADEPEEQLVVKGFLSQFRAQTAMIRNWGYQNQVLRVAKNLMNKIKEDFEEAFGLNPEMLVDAFDRMATCLNDRINLHLSKNSSFLNKRDYRNMIRAYSQAFPDTVPITESQMEEIYQIMGRNLKTLKIWLLSHSSLRLHRLYTFSLDEILEFYGDPNKREILGILFDSWSFCFGELQHHNPEHFLLANPVWGKPFIKIDENHYFNVMLGILPHILMTILEGSISTQSELKERYERVRGRFLEEEVEKLFRENFPNCQIFAGNKWKSTDSETEYENDLTMILDSFLFVIECKAGSVNAPAKRGAPETLRDVFEKLVVDPSDQGDRFIQYLKNNIGFHHFRTKNGTVNTFSNSSIRYYVRLTITFENLGLFGSNLKHAIKAGFISKDIKNISPVICFTDLEAIFQILETQAEKVHYLIRRKEFESHVNYYGDELDLLSFYLTTGFNIGEDEFDQNVVMDLSSKSKEIDPYFLGREKGVSVEKPQLAKTDWWKNLLTYIEKQRLFNGWLEGAFMLLCASKQDQMEFEKRLKKLKPKVKARRAPHEYNWVAGLIGPAQRRFQILGFPYFKLSSEERNQVIQNSVFPSSEEEYLKGSICLGFELNRNDYPYSVLAIKEGIELLEDP